MRGTCSLHTSEAPCRRVLSALSVCTITGLSVLEGPGRPCVSAPPAHSLTFSKAPSLLIRGLLLAGKPLLRDPSGHSQSGETLGLSEEW